MLQNCWKSLQINSNGRKVCQLGINQQKCQNIFTCCHTSACYAKNEFQSLKKQSKIMGKLFGNRMPGSKKRWYPDATERSGHRIGQNGIFKAAHLSRPGGSNKTTMRRVAVLNKLFMEQISSLMATSEAFDPIIGHGVQLTRVKIAPDFAALNVYWMGGKGDPERDGKLSDELKRCSGLLRHELSQLRVMGEVPRISFVHDKTFANIEHVDALLRNMDFGDTEDDYDQTNVDWESCDAKQRTENDVDQKQCQPAANEKVRIKKEFFGQADFDNKPNGTTSENAVAADDCMTSLPAMRQDVLGLDHRGIMSKIMLKMRKSKQAWDNHNQCRINEGCIPSVREANTGTNADSSDILKNIGSRIEDDKEKAEEFTRFLAQRRKNTPERKKYRADDHLVPLATAQRNSPHDDVLSETQRRLLYEEDYMIEEHQSPNTNDRN